MFIKQLSIFVENKSGKIADVLDVLGKNGIDISALSIADTTDFGIVRLIGMRLSVRRRFCANTERWLR